jgi:ABC-type transport system involved in cytochrome c biogenesis permease subunit
MKIFRWGWLALTLGLLGYAFYQGMYVAPTEATMGDIQRIFYYHFPSAMMTFLFFFISFISRPGAIIPSVRLAPTRRRWHRRRWAWCSVPWC